MRTDPAAICGVLRTVATSHNAFMFTRVLDDLIRVVLPGSCSLLSWFFVLMIKIQAVGFKLSTRYATTDGVLVEIWIVWLPPSSSSCISCLEGSPSFCTSIRYSVWP